MRMARHCLRCVVVLSSLGLAPARAAELQLPNEPYNYTVIDQDLRTALREFGANLNLRMNLSEAVQGRIRGRMSPLPAREFLDRVMAMYGLDWYYDGYTVSITAQAEGSSRVLSTPGLTFPQFKLGLETLGVLDSRYVARPQGAGSGLVLVGGPPRYLQLVEQATALLVAQAAAKPPAPPGVVVVQGANPAPTPGTAPVIGRPAPTLTIFRAGQEQRVTFP